MTKFIITKNGHAISGLHPFNTEAEAFERIRNMADADTLLLDVVEVEIGNGNSSITEVTPDSSVGAQFVKTQNQLNEVEAELNALKAENARLQAQFDYVSAHVTSWSNRWNKMSEYIQASIDREEWSETMLEDEFWQHLESEFDLDLKQTEEVEISLVVTYTGTVTVPKGTDLSDLVVDNETLLDVSLDGKNVGDVSWSEEEFDRY